MADTQLGALVKSIGGTAVITGTLSAAGIAAAASRDETIGVPIRHDAAAFTLLGVSWIFDTLSVLLRQPLFPWRSTPVSASGLALLVVLAAAFVLQSGWGNRRLPSWAKDPLLCVVMLALAVGALSVHAFSLYTRAMEVRDFADESLTELSLQLGAGSPVIVMLEALQSSDAAGLWSYYGEHVLLSVWTGVLGAVCWYGARSSGDTAARADGQRKDLKRLVVVGTPIVIAALFALQCFFLPSVYGLYILAGVRPQCVEVIRADNESSMGFEISAGALGDSRLHVIEVGGGLPPLARSWSWDQVQGRRLRPRECGESIYREGSQ